MASRSNVLVIGGTGGVGEGIVDALLANGHFERVLVSSRDESKLKALATRVNGDPRLVTIHGNVNDATSATAVLAAAQTHGTLGAVVASLGGWWEGPHLTDLDDAQWHAAFAALLTPHFIAARMFIPALEFEGARYLMIGGGAALTPVPGATLVSIAGAAQLMFARSLVAERRDRRYPIIEELVVEGAVQTNAAHHGPVTAGEITAREVGDVAADLLHTGTTGDWPDASREGPIVTIRAKRKPASSALRPT